MKTLLMRNARCIATFDHAEPAHLTGCRIESNAPQVRREHAGPNDSTMGIGGIQKVMARNLR